MEYQQEHQLQSEDQTLKRKPWYHATDFPELRAVMSEEDRNFFLQTLGQSQADQADQTDQADQPEEEAEPAGYPTAPSHGITIDQQHQLAAIALSALTDAAALSPGSHPTTGKPINLRVTCPYCKKKTCDIMVDNGVYHCWRCLDISGQLPELRQQPQKNSNAIDARYYAQANSQNKSRGIDHVDMRPADYQEISPETRSWLYPVYPYQSADEEQAFQQHFHPQGLTARCKQARLPLLPQELASLQGMVQRYCQQMHLSPDVIRHEGVMCAYLYVQSQDQSKEDPQGKVPVPAIAYCNRVMGKIVNVKFRSVDQDPITGEYTKHFMQQSPTTPCAHYGIDSLCPLRPGAEPIPRLIITEGEKDRLTLMSCGYPYVLSVANGASTDLDKSGEAFKEWIQQAEEIIICGDSDLPGRKLVKRLLIKYGDRAKLAELPQDTKDISDVMQAYGPQEVRHIIETATDQLSNFEYNFEAQRDNILQVMMGNYDHGYEIGMGPLTDHIFHPTNEGGLIIVTGIPNSGKTDFLNCMMAHVMYHCQKKVGFLSFELPNKAKHIRNIARIALGVESIEQELRDANGKIGQQKIDLMLKPTIDYLGQHMVDFQTDNARPTPKLIIQIAERHRKSHGLDYLVIDPYLFVDLGDSSDRTTETERVKAMLTLIQTWSRKHGVWTVIVAHPRIQHKEMGGEMGKLNFYDISGSAQWANLADFIFCVRRVNKPEEHKVYTVVDMQKVRDQEFCRPSEVYYMRQPCGRYEERADEQACILERTGTKVMQMDMEPWVLLS